MSKKKEDINPKRGKRLKTLLKQENTTQEHLSDTIGVSQQWISKVINGKAQLTERMAHDIAALYPEKNLLYKWLLCEEDYQSWIEKLYGGLAEAEEEQILLHRGFFAFAALDGYEVTTLPKKANGSGSLLDIKSTWDLFESYQIRKAGKIIAEFNPAQLNELENKAFNLFSVFLRDYLK